MPNTIRTIIVGAAGYTGLELVTLLLRHGGAELVGLFGSASRADGPTRTIADEFPQLRGVCGLPIEPWSADGAMKLAPKAAFLCTPHEASIDIAAQLLAHGVVVFDLSAAFRLADAALYPKHYGFEHQRRDLLSKAVYGLAEINRAAIARANLIAVPGCYPTSAILPLRPLIDADLLVTSRDSATSRDHKGAVSGDARSPMPGPLADARGSFGAMPIIIDSISGVSGAGREARKSSLFCEVSAGPYNVLRHRHQPEIALHAGADVIFTPHLGPYERGIVSTMHATLRPGVAESDLRRALERRYLDEPFIRLLPVGVWPSVRSVAGTNFCDIALGVDGDHLVLCSAIDNLLKGASGQALQCFNARFGFAETTALLPAPTNAPTSRDRQGAVSGCSETSRDREGADAIGAEGREPSAGALGALGRRLAPLGSDEHAAASRRARKERTR